GRRAGLTRLRDDYLGWQALPRELLDREIEFFRLSPADVAAIKAAPFNERFHIAIGLQLAFTRLTGCKLERLDPVPKAVLELLAGQFGVRPPRIASPRSLYRRRQTQSTHQTSTMNRPGSRPHERRQDLQTIC